MKFAVVGGGITGVSIAYQLAKQGESVALYERSARLGGLVGSFRIGQVWLEKYFHHIFLSDTAVRKTIQEVGLEKDLVWKKTAMGFYARDKIYPFDGALDLLKFSALSFEDRIRFGFNVWKAGRMKDGLRLDSITAKEWIASNWGGEIYERFWGPLLRSKFSDAADEISAAWLWGRISARANSRSGGKEKLGYVRGGFMRLLESMAKKISEQRGDLRLHEQVKQVTRASSYGWRVTTDKDTTDYDAVILALPSPLIPPLCPDLPEEETRIHKSISYVAISCMPILMNRPLSHIYWLNVGDRSIPFTGVIEQTNYLPKEDYEGVHIAYLFNYLPQGHPWLTESKIQLFARYEEGLKKIFPAYRRDQIQQIMIFRDTYANVIYEKNYLKKRPPIASQLPGLYFANTAHIFPEDRNQNYSIELAERVVRTIKMRM